MGVKEFVYKIEECIISTLLEYNIVSERIDGRIGIWIEKGTINERKIAAIGIKCSRYITMHGLALNVNTDLKLFNHIIPCGIKDKEVTSVQKEINRSIDIVEIKTSTKQVLVTDRNSHEFLAGDILTYKPTDTQYTVSSVNAVPDINKFSGDLLFIDNRTTGSYSDKQVVTLRTVLRL